MNGGLQCSSVPVFGYIDNEGSLFHFLFNWFSFSELVPDYARSLFMMMTRLTGAGFYKLCAMSEH